MAAWRGAGQIDSWGGEGAPGGAAVHPRPPHMQAAQGRVSASQSLHLGKYTARLVSFCSCFTDNVS